MISKERREELKKEGKIKSGKVVVLKKGVPTPKETKHPMADFANSLEASLSSMHKDNKQLIETITRSIQDRVISIPKDMELTDLIKKLPDMIEGMNKRYSKLMEDVIFLLTERTNAKAKKWEFEVITQFEDSSPKRIVAREIK